MSEWMPIESAPRTGELVDLWCSWVKRDGNIEIGTTGRFPDCRYISDGRWEDIGGTILSEIATWPQHISKRERIEGAWKIMVTHWMQQPEPPK